jgi:hypothetical protein
MRFRCTACLQIPRPATANPRASHGASHNEAAATLRRRLAGMAWQKAISQIDCMARM